MKVNEDRGRHLELIQGIVARMAGNSFMLKGWSVTLAAGLFALAARDSDWRVAAIALLPTVAFWCLDAYYLHQERLFRGLYDAVRSGQAEAFTLDTSLVRAKVRSWRRALGASAVLGVHGPILASVIVVVILLSHR
jgi:hypothetical protein